MNNKDTANLYALNPDGGLKWKYASISTKDTSRSFDLLSIRSDGTIYVGGEGALFAVNPDGSILWSYEDVFQVEGMLIGTDGTLYVLNGGTLVALNEKGDELWESDLDIMLLGSIGQDGTIYAFEYEDWNSQTVNILALTPEGVPKWRYEYLLGMMGINPSPAIGDDGTVYDAGMYLTAISSDGNCLWKYNQHKEYYNPSICAEGNIYAVGLDEMFKWEVFALDDSGRPLWKYKIPGEKRSVGYPSPVVGSDGTVYVGESFHYFWDWIPEDDYSLYAFDKQGKLLWRYRMDGFLFWTPPLLAQDGTLYLCTSSDLRGEENQNAIITALQTESMGLAASSWPRAWHDNQNTGRAGAP